jgi:hypothetical protein
LRARPGESSATAVRNEHGWLRITLIRLRKFSSLLFSCEKFLNAMRRNAPLFLLAQIFFRILA